jgi:hypothetical protein
MSSEHLESPSLSAIGVELIEARQHMDSAECAWLMQLAEFDRTQAYVLDGLFSSASWLVARCGMSRPTAKEKVRVARELQRRPRILAAFENGSLSYSKVRALTRLAGVEDATDVSLIEAAMKKNADELEQLVEYYRMLQNQDRDDPSWWSWLRRGVRMRRYFDGVASLEVTGPVDMLERFVNLIDELRRHQERQRLAEPVDSAESTGDARVRMFPNGRDVDDALAHDGLTQERFDALCDLLDVAAAHLEDDHGGIDVERANLSVIIDYETLVSDAPGLNETSAGRLLTGEAARRLACEARFHRMIMKGRSAILDVGTSTREWNRPQRRAIRARHGNCCAVGACGNGITQIHHILWVSEGGATRLELAVPLCGAHHVLVHEGGWAIAYDPESGITTLSGPQGQVITSDPCLKLKVA